MTFSSPPSSGVRWIPAGDSARSTSNGALAARSATSAERVGAWLVMMLLFACVAIAVLDLYVLLAHLR